MPRGMAAAPAKAWASWAWSCPWTRPRRP